MPLQWAHSLFFAAQEAPAPSAIWTYPFWGTSVHTANTLSSFGVIPFEIRRKPRPSGPRQRGFWARQWKGAKRLWQQIGRKMPERLWVSAQLVRLAFSPTYAAARTVVRRVAVSGAPRGNDLVTYMQQRAIYYGHGENMYRRFEAEDLLAFALGERRVRSAGWERGAAIEAAYLALRGRGQ